MSRFYRWADKVYIFLQCVLLAAVLIAQYSGRYALTDLFVYSAVTINAAAGVLLIVQKTKSPAAKAIGGALCLTFFADTFLVLLDDHYVMGVFLFCCVQTL